MGQWQEDFAACLPPIAHDILYAGVTAAEIVLIAQPLPDAHGRVPLLARRLSVIFKDLMDDRHEPTHLRTRLRLAEPVLRRLGVLEDLLKRPPAQVVMLT